MSMTSANEFEDEALAWHAQSPEDVVAFWNTDPTKGLDSDEVTRRIGEHGKNSLPEEKRAGVLVRLARQFNNAVLYVLIVAAVVAMALQHWVDGIVIAVVVFVNALIGFLQEGKAERAIEAIRHLIVLRAQATRGGEHIDVDAADLVPGDIVLLEAGDKVPGDMRLLETANMCVDEAALTGESVPVEKDAQLVLPAKTAIGDRRCMAFAGTLVARGQARGVVVATGARTEIGRIGVLISNIDRGSTPMLKQMTSFGRRVTVAIVALAIAVFLIGYFGRGMPVRDVFLAAVSVAVAAIPEALPAIMTISMAIGVSRIAARNAVIRRLPAVETLGAVTVVCSDKTGTLTCNEMTVQHVRCRGIEVSVSGVGYQPKGALQRVGDATELSHADIPPVIVALGEACALCNDAALHEDESGNVWSVAGDPMEGALLTFAMKVGVLPSECRLASPRTMVIPFDSDARYMATCHKAPSAAKGDASGREPPIAGLPCIVKGAPEVVLELCASSKRSRQRKSKKGKARSQSSGGGRSVRIFDADGVGVVTDSMQAWEDAIHANAVAGRRVLAIAKRYLPLDHPDLTHNDIAGGQLALLGIVSMVDPPRAEAIEAVSRCRSAGIRVIMITGDHAITASAIAKQMALIGESGSIDESGVEQRVVTGQEISAMRMDSLRRLVTTASVFARASPEHKLRLVQALKLDHQIVAMTGDGVNDAPALKQADVGIAMGLRGTESAKQAASMVLLDDNFVSVADAIEEGRAVCDKLQKTVVFLLPINGAESLSIIVAIIMGEALPIAPVQILWVNMVSAVVLALSLAFDPTESSVMRRPPKPVGESLLSRFVLWRLLLVSAMFLAGVFGMFEYSLRIREASVDRARTAAVNALVCMEAFYLLSVRRLKQPLLSHMSASAVAKAWYTVAAVLCVAALQAVFTYAPWLHGIFGTEAIPGTSVAVILGLGAGVFAVMEAEKVAIRALKDARLSSK